MRTNLWRSSLLFLQQKCIFSILLEILHVTPPPKKKEDFFSLSCVSSCVNRIRTILYYVGLSRKLIRREFSEIPK